MGFMNGVWSSLKFSSLGSVYNVTEGLDYRYLKKGDGNLVYKNNRAYVSVAAHWAKQVTMQALEAETNKLFSRYQKHIEDKYRKKAEEFQKQKLQKLVEKQKVQNDNWGKITAEGGKDIVAKDKYGTVVPEALLLYYDGDTQIDVEDVGASSSGDNDDNSGAQTVSWKTKTVCFVDLAPKVNVQSAKNIVMTTVQGRDFTRKELISGGDITFTISGEINSNQDGVYPENDVKKFIQIMQYGGIVNVHHLTFGQFNVKQVIIKDFSLSPPEFKNIQPYSFSCVAVEPSEDVVVKKDTIAILNEEFKAEDMSSWYKFVLNNKLAEGLANAATSTVTSFTSLGLDVITPNI